MKKCKKINYFDRRRCSITSPRLKRGYGSAPSIFSYFFIFLLTILVLQPNYALAAQTALGDVSSFGELISVVWSYGAQIIVMLAILLVIVGAFFYILSGGNEERISTGKQLMWGSLVAILIVLFSGVLIRILHQPAAGTQGTLADVPEVIQNATNILVGLMGAFTVLMLIYSGFLYATGRGDPDKIYKAHQSLKYAIYGLAMALVAYTAVNTLVNYFI